MNSFNIKISFKMKVWQNLDLTISTCFLELLVRTTWYSSQPRAENSWICDLVLSFKYNAMTNLIACNFFCITRQNSHAEAKKSKYKSSFENLKSFERSNFTWSNFKFKIFYEFCFMSRFKKLLHGCSLTFRRKILILSYLIFFAKTLVNFVFPKWQ